MKKRILSLLPLVLLLAAMLCTPALALTEAEVEVEAEVAASSKASVTGNVLIWFLCAVAFLKVSQKIDSFLSSLGINAGRTGGSLMAEAMIAARGVSMLVKAGGGAIGAMGGGGRQGGSSPGTASSGPTGGFFKGGLIGMAGRHITNSAVKTATTQTSAVHTAQKQSAATATNTANTIRSGGTHTASSTNTNGTIHTASTVSMGGADNTIHSAEHTGILLAADMSLLPSMVGVGSDNRQSYFLSGETFNDFYYLTNDHHGDVILGLLCDPDRRAALDGILSEDLALARPGFIVENDAMEDGSPALFAYTYDLPRIKRFDSGLMLHGMTGTLYCFDFQEDALRQMCGADIDFRCIDFDEYESRQ